MGSYNQYMLWTASKTPASRAAAAAKEAPLPAPVQQLAQTLLEPATENQVLSLLPGSPLTQ